MIYTQFACVKDPNLGQSDTVFRNIFNIYCFIIHQIFYISQKFIEMITNELNICNKHIRYVWLSFFDLFLEIYKRLFCHCRF